VPTAGRAKLFLLGKHAPKGGRPADPDEQHIPRDRL
jgi:hypothetical protein